VLTFPEAKNIVVGEILVPTSFPFAMDIDDAVRFPDGSHDVFDSGHVRAKLQGQVVALGCSGSRMPGATNLPIF
jgi:hypothetical protein